MPSNASTSKLPEPVLTQISADEWAYEVECPNGETFDRRGYRTWSAALEAAHDRRATRASELHSERKAAAGKRGGTKSHPKQTNTPAWAARTRELMATMSMMEAAKIAANETGFQLAASYKAINNQLRDAERPAPIDEREERRRILDAGYYVVRYITRPR